MWASRLSALEDMHFGQIISSLSRTTSTSINMMTMRRKSITYCESRIHKRIVEEKIQSMVPGTLRMYSGSGLFPRKLQFRVGECPKIEK